MRVTIIVVCLSGQQQQTPTTMNNVKTLRAAQTLVTFNGFGSSSGRYYEAGTPGAEVMKDLLAGVGKSEADTDKLKRQRTTYAKLISDKTGRTLRKWSEAELLKMKEAAGE